MSTGRSAAKRESRKQRQLLDKQRRETQKELAEEKDIQARNERALLRSKEGTEGLLSQQMGLKSLLGAFNKRSGSGGGNIGPNVTTGGGEYFIQPSDVGASLLPIGETGRDDRRGGRTKEDIKKSNVKPRTGFRPQGEGSTKRGR